MQETKHITHADDEIDFRELFRVIWARKWLIIVVAAFFNAASVYYALQLPDIYKSEATLAPAEDGGLKVPGQLGGLAALAGVNLSGMGDGNKTGLALEILKSRDFIGRFIEENDLYIPIMAAEGWNRAEDKLLINPEVYSEETQKWVRKVAPPFQPKPSNLEAVEAFNKILSVNQEKTSGMVKLSIEHYSPLLAKRWVDMLVKAINEEMRRRELDEAERSIIYLNGQIAQTNLADIRTMLFSLIEEQTKTLMLANVRNEYVFKTVDPAVVAEAKSKPKRALIVFSLITISFLVIFLIVFLTCLLFRKNKNA